MLLAFAFDLIKIYASRTVTAYPIEKEEIFLNFELPLIVKNINKIWKY